MARAAQLLLLISILFQAVQAGIWLQSPRGSNNRLNENTADVRNPKRVFQSKNIRRGGYNIGDKELDAAGRDKTKQYLMEHFMSGREYSIDDTQKTSLMLEWTNDEGCGTNNGNDNQQNQMNCNIVIQFNCRPAGGDDNDHDYMRDGTDTHTNEYHHHRQNPETKQSYDARKQRVRGDRAVHETFEEYEKCHQRDRNEGLYTGDVQVRKLSAIGTRQNPDGHRHGYECPEERDYYPYWHPTSWRDIAVMSENTTFCKNFYQKESFNVKTKYECMVKYPDVDEYHAHSKANNEEDCKAGGGEWLEFTNYLEFADQYTTPAACNAASDDAIQYVWGRPMGHHEARCLVGLLAPECHDAPWTRPNHVGNTFGTGEPVGYEWKLPHFPSGESQRCVLRVRYNATSNDFPPHATDQSKNALDYTVLSDSACPMEPGYCVKADGHDQNHRVIKVNNHDGDTEQRQKECLQACLQKVGATGCEVIWHQGNRGCYIHTQEVARGNFHARHACWILKRCKGKGPVGFSPKTEFGLNLAFERPTSASSDDHGGKPQRATDGNVAQSWHDASCTHTKVEDNPWWRVDLGQSHKIDMVVLYNRGDCCTERLSGFRVSIGDNVNGDDNAVCKQGGSTAGSKIVEVYCDQPLEGRYVEVKIPGSRKILTLCEVQVLEFNPDRLKNLAQGKHAETSSVDHGGIASRITDGNENTHWGGRSCMHTRNENNPWVMVDLGGAAIVNHVVIYNRRDGGQDRLTGSVVTIGDNSAGVNNAQCGAAIANSRLMSKVDVYCEPALKGRYVHVKQMASGNRVMNLCEIKVYGIGGGNAPPKLTGAITDDGVNLARSAVKVAQASTAHGGNAERAIDGNTDGNWRGGSCTHTHHQNKPWFWIDLGKKSKIAKVVLYNRRDCCSNRLNNAMVFIGNDPQGKKWEKCGDGPANADRVAKIDVPCRNPQEAQYVLVYLDGRRTLTLCEVQVFAAKEVGPTTPAPTSAAEAALPNSLPSAKPYSSVGCFKDTDQRAISTIEGQCGLLDGNYKQRVDAIEKCFKCALELGNTMFAVQDGGWCATSRNAKDTYQKYGAVTNCNAEGSGGAWANHVYEIAASSDGDETPDPTIPPFVLDDSTFKVRTNPIIDTGVNNLKLQLAMRSRNVFSTNQDRTHVFYMHKRPDNVATKTIHNLNVRGKRGNIVQTFPANEYDFFPTDLKIKQDELVHIQWTGSNTHNNKNDGDAGEGTGGTDRSNIVQIKDRSVNYPITPLKDAPMFMNATVHWASEPSSKEKLEPIDVAVQMATAGYLHCEKDCCHSAEGRFAQAPMQDQLNNAPASYKGMLLSFAKGEYHYMCSRNNNFSNRAQKASIVVT